MANVVSKSKVSSRRERRDLKNAPLKLVVEFSQASASVPVSASEIVSDPRSWGPTFSFAEREDVEQWSPQEVLDELVEEYRLDSVVGALSFLNDSTDILGSSDLIPSGLQISISIVENVKG